MAWWEQPGTTDIKGAAFGNPTREDVGALRAIAAQNEAAGRAEVANMAAVSRDEAAARTSGAVRGEGTLTKYRPVGGWRTPAGGGEAVNVVANSAELGAPTSYDGGTGAPEPITVMRGMRQTYAPLRQAGQQFIEGEFATPTMARQAFNRAAGTGEYVPPEGPRLQAADKNPDRKAAADMVTRAEFGKVLNERVLKDYGVKAKGEDGKDTWMVPPEIQRLTLGHRPGSQEEVESILQQIKPEADKAKSITLYNDLKNPETLGLRNRAASLYPNDPKMQEFIKTAPIDQNNLTWFQGQFAKVPQAAPPSGAPLRASATEPAGSFFTEPLGASDNPLREAVKLPFATGRAIYRDILGSRDKELERRQQENLRRSAPAM
jgi:hypothetical protein